MGNWLFEMESDVAGALLEFSCIFDVLEIQSIVKHFGDNWPFSLLWLINIFLIECSVDIN